MSYCVPCSAVCAEKRIKPGGVYFMAQCLRAEKWIWGLICRFKPRRKQQGSLVRFLLRPSGEVNELRQESGLTSRPPPVREVASSEPAVDGNIWTSCSWDAVCRETCSLQLIFEPQEPPHGSFKGILPSNFKVKTPPLSSSPTVHFFPKVPEVLLALWA